GRSPGLLRRIWRRTPVAPKASAGVVITSRPGAPGTVTGLPVVTFTAVEVVDPVVDGAAGAAVDGLTVEGARSAAARDGRCGRSTTTSASTRTSAVATAPTSADRRRQPPTIGGG